MLELREQICIHVKKSISHKQYSDELSFPIPDKSVKRIKSILHFDMQDYQCIIRSHDVRHVHRGHPDDVEYICEIPEIIQKFHKVNKSITRDKKTGATLVNLEFYKNYSNNTVKLVKLKIHRDKRLELKTIFIQD